MTTVISDFYTIGVYGQSAEEFFSTLVTNQIDTFIDIRRRRAVRGSKFSFVNSKRLQNKLRELGINYIHILELAPTNEIRELQKSEDKKLGVLKRERNELGKIFVSEYKKQILEQFDLSELIKKLSLLNAQRPVLFCVEKEPEACHRSIVSSKLAVDYNSNIHHL